MRSFLSKTLMLFAFLIGIAFQANAQDTNVKLILTMTNGEEVVYQLSEASQIYFEDGVRLIIDEGTGSPIVHPINQIRKMVCSEILGTEENSVSGLRLFPNPARNSFTILGIQETQHARIYSLDGRLMKSFEVSEGMVIDINEFPQGMHLLHVNGQTLKLMKL